MGHRQINVRTTTFKTHFHMCTQIYIHTHSYVYTHGHTYQHPRALFLARKQARARSFSLSSLTWTLKRFQSTTASSNSEKRNTHFTHARIHAHTHTNSHTRTCTHTHTQIDTHTSIHTHTGESTRAREHETSSTPYGQTPMNSSLALALSPAHVRALSHAHVRALSRAHVRALSSSAVLTSTLNRFRPTTASSNSEKRECTMRANSTGLQHDQNVRRALCKSKESHMVIQEQGSTIRANFSWLRCEQNFKRDLNKSKETPKRDPLHIQKKGSTRRANSTGLRYGERLT